MTGTSQSSKSVVLLEPLEFGDPAFLRLTARLREVFPSVTLLRDGAKGFPSDPWILLVPVDFKLNQDVLSEVFHHWIKNGSGTIFRGDDGLAYSRFILFSEQAVVDVPAELSYLLDGSDKTVLALGATGSSGQQQFLSFVHATLESGALQHGKSMNVEGVERYLRDRFKKHFPQLAYHNPVHIQDVYDSSVRIAEAEGVTGVDIDLLRIGALFHDAGFMHSMVRHEEYGANMAAGVLPAFGFSMEQIAIICQMILATRVPQSPKSLLDQILCDADLDYLGRDDFYPIGGRLFTELKQIGVVQDEHSWNTIQKKFLSAHAYHTRYSRVNREPGKLARLREIEAMLN